MQKSYSFQKLADYVWAFCTELQLVNPSSSVVIALSGGKDSRLLFELALYWKNAGYLSALRALHYHHGLRLESDDEEVFVRELCASNHVEIVTERNGSPLKSEGELRQARHQFFNKHLKAGELLLLGHHLDDSFEWSLRQMARVSELKSVLGMPAKNRRLRRPLMCLSSAQIEYACQQFDLNYCQDQSNDSLYYERNYIRHEIVPKLRKLSPKILKNYVARSEALAARLGLSLRGQKAGRQRIVVQADKTILGMTHLLWPAGQTLAPSASEKIISILKSLSENERGTWREQVAKLVRASGKGWAGPFLFSGGVKALIVPGRIIFYSYKNEDKLIYAVGKKVDEAHGLEASIALKSGHWLYYYNAIDFNDYPSLKNGHILSKWAGFEGLITREQVERLSPKKQRILRLSPVC